MTRDELKEMLGASELLTVTREQVQVQWETLLDHFHSGGGPVLIVADGKHDLLMFSWEDYKQRFSLLYPPEEFTRLEKAFKSHKE